MHASQQALACFCFILSARSNKVYNDTQIFEQIDFKNIDTTHLNKGSFNRRLLSSTQNTLIFIRVKNKIFTLISVIDQNKNTIITLFMESHVSILKDDEKIVFKSKTFNFLTLGQQHKKFVKKE